MTYNTRQYEGSPECRACGQTKWSRNQACCKCEDACCDLCATVLPNDELLCRRCQQIKGNEGHMILMDRLDDLFDTISKHDWDVPLWMRSELRNVQAQYRRINRHYEVPEEDT